MGWGAAQTAKLLVENVARRCGTTACLLSLFPEPFAAPYSNDGASGLELMEDTNELSLLDKSADASYHFVPVEVISTVEVTSTGTSRKSFDGEEAGLIGKIMMWQTWHTTPSHDLLWQS